MTTKITEVKIGTKTYYEVKILKSDENTTAVANKTLCPWNGETDEANFYFVEKANLDAFNRAMR